MPALSPSGLLQRLAEGDADVFDRVVLIDVQIALGLHVQIDRRVLGQQREHVIEEADAGGNLALPGAVEIQLDADFGFGGFAIDGGGARHGNANSNYEFRNPKLPKHECKAVDVFSVIVQRFRISNFELVSDFEIRALSNYTMPCSRVRQASICSSVPTEILSPSPQPG